MKKTIGSLMGLALMACMLTAPVHAFAQQDGGDTIINSLELDQADVRDALKILFRSTGLNYTVAPDVQGVITVSLKDVPFKTALRNVLNQVDSTWREEGGIYNIIRKPAVTTGTGETTIGPATTTTNRIRKIPVRNADPALIALLLAGSGSPYQQPEMSTNVGGGSSGGFGGSGGGFGGGQGGGFGGGGFGGGSGGFGGGSGGFGGGSGGFGGGSGGFGGGGLGR